MVAMKADNSSDTNALLEAASAGNGEKWGALLARHRDRLRRMVALRMDRRLQGRIDPSDVIQEACLEASNRFSEYCKNPSMPFFLWLRFLTGQKLLELHRVHLKAQIRDICREVSLYHGSLPETTSAALAAHLMGHLTRPSEAAIQAEMKIRLQEALNSMAALDREILALRHFEHLTNRETARVLDIQERAASKRYIRALKRLKEILSSMPGGLGDVMP